MIRISEIPAAPQNAVRFGPFTSVVSAAALFALCIVMAKVIFA